MAPSSSQPEMSEISSILGVNVICTLDAVESPAGARDDASVQTAADALLEDSLDKRPSSRASSLTLASLSAALSRRSSVSSATLGPSSTSRLHYDDQRGLFSSSGPSSLVPTGSSRRSSLRSRIWAALHRPSWRRGLSPAAVAGPAPIMTTPAQDAEMRRLAMHIKNGGSPDDDVRILQLKYDAIVANASAKPRATEGLFKEACSTDLLFLIDTTGSMMSYINAAKDQVRSIMKDIKAAFFDEANVRIAVVAYKDHGDTSSIQFLDFTPSADNVRAFLDQLTAFGGGDLPEDVLGGIQQALNATWTQRTRCIIHIADAPPHGRTLHNLGEDSDRYATPGSEPHRLTHEPLLKQMIGLNINYALLRINDTTDRMAYTFLQAYAAAAPECKLHSTNKYYSQACELSEGIRSGSGPKRRGKALQFEEQELGTTYSALRHLVVKSVTTSASRTASRISGSTARENSFSTGSWESGGGGIGSGAGGSGSGSGGGSSRLGPLKRLGMQLKAIKEDEGAEEKDEDEDEKEHYMDESKLETAPPNWAAAGWLDKTLMVEAFSTDVAADTLDSMIADDTTIKITAADLTIHKRSRPFAQGAMRVAAYARTAASTSPLVVKSFKRDGKHLAHLVDDMRCQVLCKAFALEFNALVGPKNAIDFIVATCLKPKSDITTALTPGADGCMSLEPFIDGAYVKYNSNSGYVNPDTAGDAFGQAAQAFSHFTFERSRGRFLVADLQGVGNMLTDPAVHTLDPERFKLADTNLGVAGFKFFFATHQCNAVCAALRLKSDAASMFRFDEYVFREDWLPAESDGNKMVCCANKLCRRIVAGTAANASDEFAGFHWCDACWPQLEATKAKTTCVGSTPGHEFEVSRFFYESQGREVPHRCAEHLVEKGGHDVEKGGEGLE